MSRSDPSPVDPAEPYETPPGASLSGIAPTGNERNLAMLAHLTGGLGAVFGGLAGFLGPLIIWILQKEESNFVSEQAKEALNFQITLLIMYAATVVLAMFTCFIGWFLPLIPWVLALVFGVISSLNASKGIPYRYPFNLRLVT